ncbi:abl interactor homolog [Telopea speciosissima]|uniref:abl interactor homolog n=1 Tax=Telopea speciosissima TaxID=54955 RepID=UPI001CC549F1|nr:abl interactor homolog [Telopea speciosissima]
MVNTRNWNHSPPREDASDASNMVLPVPPPINNSVDSSTLLSNMLRVMQQEHRDAQQEQHPFMQTMTNQLRDIAKERIPPPIPVATAAPGTLPPAPAAAVALGNPPPVPVAAADTPLAQLVPIPPPPTPDAPQVRCGASLG